MFSKDALHTQGYRVEYNSFLERYDCHYNNVMIGHGSSEDLAWSTCYEHWQREQKRKSEAAQRIIDASLHEPEIVGTYFDPDGNEHHVYAYPNYSNEVQPNSPAQYDIYNAGYRIYANGVEFHAFNPQKQRIAVVSDLSQCWTACYEVRAAVQHERDEQYKRRGLGDRRLYNQTAAHLVDIMSEASKYKAALETLMDNLELLSSELERLFAIERRALDLHAHENTPEHTRAVLEKMLGYKPNAD